MAQLPFLPPPYPDELLYSVCARYHQLSASPSQKQTMLDLFGCATAGAIYDLPNRLSALSSRLASNTTNTPESLLRRHTLFNFYEPFLPKARARRIADMMIGSDKGSRIHSAIGIRASSIQGLERLRLCPDCVAADAEVYGEAYWHRSHQIPGILLCHCHETPLVASTVTVFSQSNKHRFVAASQGEIGMTVHRKSVSDSDKHRGLAHMAHMLLSNQYPVIGLKGLHSRYGNILQRLRFITPGGQIIQHKLIKEFVGFYGNEFLELVGCPLESDQNDNWLTVLVRLSRRAAHPLRHLLLMEFLDTTPDDFFLRPEAPCLQFGRGPWPCLNPAANHYLKPMIRSCEIGRNSETGAPVGTFACLCGFTYSRTGPDHSKSDRFRISRMVRYGEVWENALLSFVEAEKRSLRMTARLLHVDTRTVIKHLAQLRSRCDAEKDRLPLSVDCGPQRNEWLRLCSDNPALSRTDLRKLAPAAYAKLYRHDRSWLLATGPQPVPKTQAIPRRVDWAARDREVSVAVRQVAEELSRDCGGKVKTTISMIGKRSGKLALLQQHLDKLPHTKAVLSSLVRNPAKEP